MISLICVKHVKHDTNEPICESETDSQTEDRLAVAKKWAGERWSGSLGLTEQTYYIVNE